MKSVNAIVRELERELKVRDYVYPRLIERGQLDQETADHRRDCLLSAVQMLNTQRPPLNQASSVAN